MGNNKLYFTKQEKEKIVKTYKNCLSIRKTSRECVTSDERVKDVLLEYDIDIHNPNCEYIKHKPHGYWDNKEHCEEAAKTCRNRAEFGKKFSRALSISKKNGWIKDFDQYFSLEKQFYNYNDKIHCIYVYEINKTRSVYVGRTINLKRRHGEHKNGRNGTGGKLYTDNLYKHCKTNKVEVPEPIIVESGLTAIESQRQEKYWLDKYINEGWNCINKGTTGEGCSSLGSNIKKWDYETCKAAAEQCVSKADYRRRFSTASRVSTQNKWINDFFDNKKNENGCFDTIEQCVEACRGYGKISDVKKCYPFLYHKICKNKWNKEIIERLGWYKKGVDKKTPEFQKVNNNIVKKVNIQTENVDIKQLTPFEIGIYNSLLHRDIRKVVGSKYGKDLELLIDNKTIIKCITVKNNLEFSCGTHHMDMLNRVLEANNLGYSMLCVCDSEVNDFYYIYNKIKHILGLNSGDGLLTHVDGRKCMVKEIYKCDAEPFMNEHHIQGFVNGTSYIGCYYNDMLVAVMIIKNGGISSINRWEIVRFACDGHIIQNGLFGKCFKHFIDKYKPNKVISFADRRWTIDINSNVYTKNGFVIDSINRPDFKYVDTNTQTPILHHKMYFNKQKLHKKYGFPLTMTETEMAKELGYDRIWDCGLVKYVWTRKEE